MELPELDLYHYSIICYQFTEELFFRLLELEIYHHSIICYQFRGLVF